ncbi:MAG: aminoacyl-tRNA hydrolase [Elusimicrobiota bacterium]|jgi:PTH1 family peptidyl-tRNA hydrolase|nr:aminoacyl-tRNA hydrolase [Elusimicrobiota bacterium]
MKTFLIIGLGNPGRQYADTRHNAGFMAADALAAQLGAAFAPWAKAGADYLKAVYEGNTLYVLKPNTFMNLSGTAAAAFANFYKIPPQNILVIFDDMSLPLGAVRMRGGGSAGGQNGMKNIIELFGTQDIPRVRIGTGPRPDFFEGRDFVLSKFSAAEREILKPALARAAASALDFAASGLDIAMNRANAG